MHVLTARDLLPDSGTVDLLVWPESAFPVFLDREEGRRARRAARMVARRIGAPVLVGAFAAVPEKGPGRRNAAVLVGSDGPTGFAYHKRRLVPVVERTPFLPVEWLPGSLARSEVRPGSAWPLGSVGTGARFGVLICYEAAFAGAGRAYRARGADFLVNVTNDAWYGLDAPGASTAGLWQHQAHLVMRAVETRAGAVRAANGGISLFVDPVGRTYGTAPLHRRSLRVAPVLTTDIRTLYVRLGDVTGVASVAGTILLLLAPAARRFRERGGGRAGGRTAAAVQEPPEGGPPP